MVFSSSFYFSSTQKCLPLAQTPPEAPPNTQALPVCLTRAESMPWGFPSQWSLTWPGASVCLHSHRHPAALPVPLHLLLGSAGGLAPVPSAHGGARRQCRPHALLLHAGLGRACLHHRYPHPHPGLCGSTSQGPPSCHILPTHIPGSTSQGHRPSSP